MDSRANKEARHLDKRKFHKLTLITTVTKKLKGYERIINQCTKDLLKLRNTRNKGEHIQVCIILEKQNA